MEQRPLQFATAGALILVPLWSVPIQWQSTSPALHYEPWLELLPSLTLSYVDCVHVPYIAHWVISMWTFCFRNACPCCFHPLGVPSQLPVPPFLLTQITKGHIHRSDIMKLKVSFHISISIKGFNNGGRWSKKIKGQVAILSQDKLLAKATVTKETYSTRTIMA